MLQRRSSGSDVMTGTAINLMTEPLKSKDIT